MGLEFSLTCPQTQEYTRYKILRKVIASGKQRPAVFKETVLNTRGSLKGIIIEIALAGCAFRNLGEEYLNP